VLCEASAQGGGAGGGGGGGDGGGAGGGGGGGGVCGGGCRDRLIIECQEYSCYFALSQCLVCATTVSGCKSGDGYRRRHVQIRSPFFPFQFRSL